MTTYKKNVSEPWFSLIKLKLKTVEGRLNKGEFSNMKLGDIIIFTNDELGFERSIDVKIIKIINYNTFQTYLENETLKRCLPGIDTIEEGVNIYYNIYKKEDIESKTVKAITFTRMYYNA